MQQSPLVEQHNHKGGELGLAAGDVVALSEVAQVCTAEQADGEICALRDPLEMLQVAVEAKQSRTVCLCRPEMDWTAPPWRRAAKVAVRFRM